MKIGIASDHAGYNLKSAIIKNFQDQDRQLIDCGCDNSKDSVDYPDIANNLCQKYIAKEFDLGILVCGSGIGISIAANRFKEIRAALCHNEETAMLSKKHNDANILCLGSRIVSEEVAFKIIGAFLEAKFSAGRHEARIAKLSS